MKISYKLPIPQDFELLVKINDKVSQNQVVAESTHQQDEKTIHLAKILRIPSDKIAKFLKKPIGEKIKISDLIAEKKSFFSYLSVRSPIDGVISELDLKKGTITLISQDPVKLTKIFSPVSGKIVEANQENLIIEVEGQEFRGESGFGSDSTGVLTYISGENIGTLELDKDVEDTIVICHSFGEDVLVKLNVLGASGVISQKTIVDNLGMSWVKVDNKIFDKIKSHAGKRIIIHPDEKQIIILE